MGDGKFLRIQEVMRNGNVDARLLGRDLRLSAGGHVMIDISGGWHMVNYDYSVTIELASVIQRDYCGSGSCPEPVSYPQDTIARAIR